MDCSSDEPETAVLRDTAAATSVPSYHKRPSVLPKSRTMDILEEWLNPRSSPEKPTHPPGQLTPSSAQKGKPAALPKTSTMEILEQWLNPESPTPSGSESPGVDLRDEEEHAQPPTRELRAAPANLPEASTMEMLEQWLNKTAPALPDDDSDRPPRYPPQRSYPPIPMTTGNSTLEEMLARAAPLVLAASNARSNAATASPHPEPRLPSPPPISFRQGMLDAACQTELTMQDLASLLPPHMSTPVSRCTSSNTSVCVTPDSNHDIPSGGPTSRNMPEISPDEILKDILKTKKHPDDDLYHCPSCERAFSRRFNLKTHFAAHHANVRNFSCGLCAKSFSRQFDLQRHRKLVHGLGKADADNNL
ncbi:hypothetical protein BJ742DRAFT_808057 [Cladochytrium replicatum]|nr:hypothetical protein BJ742DRAFT_808057 [Cladochytrium replicatum]